MTERSEERRHRDAVALDGEAPEALTTLLRLLGDDSWRVRKAALSTLPRFLTRPTLVVELITGLASPNVGLRNACFEALLRVGEASIDALTAALRTSEPAQRKFCAEALGTLGTARARDALITALDDADGNVRAAVAEALGTLGGAEVISPLRAKLIGAGDDLQMSVYVLDALARAEAKLPFAELEPWVGVATVSRLIYPLLGLTGDPRAIPPLLDGVRAKAKGARQVAIKATSRLIAEVDEAGRDALRDAINANSSASARITEALADSDDAVARAAVLVIGLLGDPALAPVILSASAVRPFLQTGVDVVQSMGRAVVDPLFEAFDDLDLETRVLALEVVEWLGTGEHQGRLLEIAQMGEARTTEAAVRALGRLGDVDAIPSVMALGESDDAELSRHVALALSGIGSRAPDAVAQAMRGAWESSSEHAIWITVLGALARDADVDTVSSAVHHREPAVRRAAIEAARSYGTRLAEDLLVFALADEAAMVRAAAARTLSAYRSSISVDALLVATRDEDTWVVAEALRALGRIGDARASDTLVAASGSNASPIAIAALQALFRLNPPSMNDAVGRALNHADPEVVREAISGTMRLPERSAADLLSGCLRHRSWEVRRAAAEALSNRHLRISEDLVLERLASEGEPLAREALQRLASQLGSPS